MTAISLTTNAIVTANQPARIKYSKLQLQLETILKLNLVHLNLAFGWEIYYLWASSVLCVMAGW